MKRLLTIALLMAIPLTAFTARAQTPALLEGAQYIESVTVSNGIATPVIKTWGVQNSLFGPTVAGQEFFLATARTAAQITTAGTTISGTFHGTSSSDPVDGRGTVILGLADVSAPPEASFNSWALSVSITKHPGFEAIYIQELGVLKKALTGPFNYDVPVAVTLQSTRTQVLFNGAVIYETTPLSLPVRGHFQATWQASITNLAIQ